MCRAWSTFFTSLPLPLYFPLFISVTGACLLWGMETHDRVVRFCQPLVQSHLGAGCQLWKLQATSGTQPPHSDTVVK